MKIIQLIPQLGSGGAECFVVDLSNALSLNHEVTLMVSSSLNGDQAFYLPEISQKVKVCSLQKRLGVDLAYMYRLYRAVKLESPDVVHTHMSAFKHFALLRFFFPKVKFVNTIHCAANAESGNIIVVWMRKLFYKTGLCKAVTISQKSDLSFKERYGYSMPSRVIFNGRSMDFIISEDETLVPRINGRLNLVSIGHISKVKNHLLLCLAFSKLTDRDIPIELYMFGRFANQNIVDEIKSLNNPHIHLLGEIADPRRYLHNADAFCLSSISEGLPISLIEAMSCGVIPICTAVGGITDLVNEGETGFLSDDLSVDSYVRAIERFLKQTEKDMYIMKHKCKELAMQYSMKECANRYEELYAE